MKLAFWVILFGFSLNIAVGLVTHYIPNLDSESLSGMDYRSNDVDAFTNQFNKSIDSSSAATDTNNLIDNILDKLNLGIIKKMQVWANQWMFGFVELIGQKVLQLDSFVMGILKSLLVILYVLAFINLFSGKDLGHG